MCEDPWGGAAYLAVDGNRTTTFGEYNEPRACTCAKGNRSTYWSVDLGQKYTLYDMMIFQKRKRYLFICFSSSLLFLSFISATLVLCCFLV